MKVIGAGLPRTATLTQKIALETLGIGPCYHMVNVLTHLGLAQQWIDAFSEHADWDEVFDGCQASVDWPGSFFYRDLMKAYPEAKVLLSVRDGQAWARSMQHTIWGMFYGDTMMRDLSNARRRVDPDWDTYMTLMCTMWEKSGLLGTPGACFDADTLARLMEAHNDEVREYVPADRLLVWQPADGWEPLCRFLDVPVPAAPLPRVNDSAMFADRIISSSMDVLTTWREQLTAEQAVAGAR